MTALGTLYASGSSVFTFASVQLDPHGVVPDLLQEQHEELTDVAVDGRRWRLVNRQFPQFQMTTMADATSYDSAIATERNMLLAKGKIAPQLSISLGGIIYNWRNVKIQDVKVDLSAGIMVGYGASAGSAAIIRGIWSMVLADTTRPGSV